MNPIAIVRTLALSVLLSAGGCATFSPFGRPAPDPGPLATASADSVEAGDSANAAAGQDRGSAPRQRGIADLTRSSTRYEGLFTIFQDTVTGTTRMLIREDQIGQEFIYWSYTVDGVTDANRFRGQFGENKVFRVDRDFNRISFVTQPTHLYFDPEHPLARAADANVSEGIMAVARIVASDESAGEYLIEADDIFLSEAFQQIRPITPPGARPGETFALGRISRPKSLVSAIRAYPLNTDVIVDYVFESDSPLNRGGDGVIDPRNVTIRVQHSLIAMPDNDYEPRFEDPRVGYFTNRQTDMISPDPAPYRDVITRWHLVKKDPDAEISEPVEPIVWWIENTTPHELRDLIADAALSWNRAFESAGFRNAIEVRIQPDDAEWDAGDIRYNVLRWTSSPEPPFGGYGPSFTNPRTGQILGADIMLEWTAITNRLRQAEIFDAVAMPPVNPIGFDDFLEEHHGGHVHSGFVCDAGLHLQQTMLFGREALLGLGATDVEIEEMTRQYLYYLIIHEIGHTLGLNHNMMGSQALSLEELQVRGNGVSGSVMDYPAVNVAAPGQAQGDYYDHQPGPYDHWAIEWGYSPALKDPVAEAARLDSIASLSTRKAFAFGNDADDMRSPGKAIDPRVNIYDLSDDAVTWADGRVELIRQLVASLRERYERPGGDYHAMRNAYLVLTGQQATTLTVVSRYVGGVYRDRAFVGQDGGTTPYTPVDRAYQKQAMDVLARHAFAPDAWDSPDGIVERLMMRRRGFDFTRGTEDPKIHERVLNAQRAVLAHILHPLTMQRITDSRLYGNDYPAAEVLSDLTDAIFEADLRSDVNTIRQNLQVEYVGNLIALYRSNAHDHVAKSAAFFNLQRIEEMLANRPRGNLETQAHTQHLLHRIREVLEVR